MTQKLDGKVVSERIYKSLQFDRTRTYAKTLAIITVGNDEASKVYVNTKKTKTEFIKCNFMHIHMGNYTSYKQLANLVNYLNDDNLVHGIMIQKPLLPHLKQWESEIDNLISPEKDVDGFHPLSDHEVCTPKGVIRILDEYKVEYPGKNVVIAGRSKIVAQPLAKMFMDRNCTVTMVHSHTPPDTVKKLIKDCDVFVSAIGQPNYWNSEFIKPHYKTKLALVDVGINRIPYVDPETGEEKFKIVGDVDPEVYSSFEYYTPVPGGVGLMTVASLMENLMDVD